jgi:Kef-type K+ transport system membrane component KefB
LVEIVFGLALRNYLGLQESGQWIALFAALGIALIAAYGGWHVTDRVINLLRPRPDED